MEIFATRINFSIFSPSEKRVEKVESVRRASSWAFPPFHLSAVKFKRIVCPCSAMIFKGFVICLLTEKPLLWPARSAGRVEKVMAVVPGKIAPAYLGRQFKSGRSQRDDCKA